MQSVLRMKCVKVEYVPNTYGEVVIDLQPLDEAGELEYRPSIVLRTFDYEHTTTGRHPQIEAGDIVEVTIRKVQE